VLSSCHEFAEQAPPLASGADGRDTLVRDVVHGYCRFAATARTACEKITMGGVHWRHGRRARAHWPGRLQVQGRIGGSA
jgi:hypothetical protein